MREIASFLFAHKDYFESLTRYSLLPTYTDLLGTMLPEDWELRRSDVWVMANPPDAQIPWQGFKIHVSGTVVNAQRLLRAVVPECVERSIPFKIAGDPRLLSLMGSKNYGRGSSSKFIVVYPRTTEEFVEVIQRLDAATVEEESAYILSDRRYDRSKVLFYRYGGFKDRRILRINGKRDPVIGTPDGELVVDQRLPYFQLPEWVSDPFEGSADLGEGTDTVLQDRYSIEKALSFSNSGGVYLGVDTETGDQVVIKEARPLTNAWVDETVGVLDSVRVLDREEGVLAKLAGTGVAPERIDRFQEWEHHFLVEEFIPGAPLSGFRSREDHSLLPFTRAADRAGDFCRMFRPIACNLIDTVAVFHQHNLILGDLSPANVMVDPETLGVRLIDFETAVDLDRQTEADSLSVVWSTPGFRSDERLSSKSLLFRDDLYALGMVLYSLMLPVQTLFELVPAAKERFIDRMTDAAGLPPEPKRVIFRLLEGDAEGARRILDDWDVEGSLATVPPPEDPAERRSRTLERLPEMIERTGDFLLASFDASRDDRLWPSDPEVFSTNPLCVAWGACGPLLFLARTGREIPREVLDWVGRQRLDHGTYPPGLFVGTAGIAWTLTELGRLDQGAKVLDLTYDSPCCSSRRTCSTARPDGAWRACTSTA